MGNPYLDDDEARDVELFEDTTPRATRPHEGDVELAGKTTFNTNGGGGAPHPPAKPVQEAAYQYVDQDGDLLYEVLRLRTPDGRKTFRQRRPNLRRGGGWVYDLDGVERVPYHLDEVIAAATEGRDIIVVEGEKDADRLRAELGVCTTTNAQGAGWDWPATWADYFRGAATVYVVADNDEQGIAAAHHRGRVIRRAVTDVRIVTLSELEPHGDASDYLDAGATTEALWRELEAGRPPSADVTKPAGTYNEAIFERLKASVIVGDAIGSLPPPVPLIDGILDLDSVAVVYGAPSAGKSLFTLDWALSVASGSWWHGAEVRQGPVLYVVAEGASGMGPRYKAWLGRAQVHDAEPIFRDLHWLLGAPNLYNDESAAAFIAYAATLEPVLVVLDTFARCIIGAEENSAKDTGYVVANLERLREATHATVLAVHHTPKSGEGIRGSTALEGAMDTALEVKDVDGAVTLTPTKQKNAALGGERRFGIREVEDTGSVVLVPARAGGQPVEVLLENLPAGPRKCLRALSEIDTGDGVAYGLWEKSAGVGSSTVARARKTLLDLGAVAETKAGTRKLYSITEAGRAVL